jgi:FkbM family methyltransferase
MKLKVPKFRARFNRWRNRDLSYPAEGMCAAMREETFEQADRKRVSRYIRAGDTVADIGAHCGYWSLYLSRLVGTGGSVIAVEPHADNLSNMRINLARRNVQNVTIVPCAIGLGETANLHISRYSGSHTIASVMSPGKRTGETVRVAMRTLDDVLSGSRPSFIKVDVEGGEYDVVSTGLRVLRDCRPVMLVEWWPYGWRGGLANHKAFEVLREYDYGFSPTIEFEHADDWNWSQNILCVPKERV